MPKRISTNGLTAKLRTAIQANRRVHARSKARMIEEAWIPMIKSVVHESIKQASAYEVEIVVRGYGGFVPNSYKYTGHADKVVVTLDLEAGTIDVSASRPRAPSRSYGRGSQITGRVSDTKGGHGRLVSSIQTQEG